MSEAPGETTLRNRAHCMTPRQRWILGMVVVATAAALLGVLGLAGGLGDAEGGGTAIGAASLVFGLVSLIAGARERVFVGPQGIRYLSGVPSWLGPLDRSFEVRAEDVSYVRVGPHPIGGGAALMRMEIATSAGTRHLHVFNYVAPDEPSPVDFRALMRLRVEPEGLAAMLERLPLVRWARSQGFDVRIDLPAAKTVFAARAAQQRLPIAASLAIALGCYGLLDLGIVPETYAAGFPVALIVAGGGLGALLGWLLADSEAGRSTRVGLSGLVAVTMMIALLPGLIRINRLDATPLTPHAYRLTEDGIEPVDPSSPRVDLPGADEIWRCSEPGAVHEIELRHGWLGFWQIDIDSVYASHAHPSEP